MNLLISYLTQPKEQTAYLFGIKPTRNIIKVQYLYVIPILEFQHHKYKANKYVFGI